MENQNLDRDVKAEIKKNWRLFKQSKIGITGLVIVIFFGFLSYFTTFIIPYKYLG